MVKLFLVYARCAHANVASAFSDSDCIAELPWRASVPPAAAGGPGTREKGLVSASKTPV